MTDLIAGESRDALGDEVADRQAMSANTLVWLITLAAVVVLWLIMTSWRPWELFTRAGFSADFYDEQARAFLRGELAVDPQVASIEGFLIDGRTYLYYGPFLSLVRLPLMLFGDVFVGRLARVSMMVALVVLGRWSARLARAGCAVVRSTGRTISDEQRWPIGIFTAAVVFSPALFAAGWVSVYHETELWALTLAVVAATLIVEWASSGFDDRRALVGATLATFAATLTRLPIGVGICLVLVTCGAVLGWRTRRQGWRTALRSAWIPLIGGTVPVVGHVVVNWAKFSTPFGVPGASQVLSLTDPDRAAWFVGNNGSFFSLRFLPTTVVQYLRPDAIAFERLVPGIRFGPLASDRGSYPVETITPSSSLTVSATLLLLLAAVGAVWLLRHRNRVWLLIIAATSAATLPTFAIGFIANRYLIDMLAPLVVAGALGVWRLGSLPWRRSVRAAGVALAVWGLWVNASLATWTAEAKSAGFTELRYFFDQVLFGAGSSPSLVILAAGSPVPRDGVVAVDGDCLGVYMAEQGNWVALERADGVRRTTGTVSSGGDVLAQGRGWTIEYRNDQNDPRIVVVSGEDGDVVFEQSIDHALAGVLPVTFEVLADPITSEYAARIGTVWHLLPGDVIGTGGPIAESTAVSPLCQDMLRRALPEP